MLFRSAGYRVTGCDANVYPPMNDQLGSRSDRLKAKWATCKDPYWISWLESAVRFAIWQETGQSSNFPGPAESPVAETPATPGTV